MRSLRILRQLGNSGLGCRRRRRAGVRGQGGGRARGPPRPALQATPAPGGPLRASPTSPLSPGFHLRHLGLSHLCHSLGLFHSASLSLHVCLSLSLCPCPSLCLLRPISVSTISVPPVRLALLCLSLLISVSVSVSLPSSLLSLTPTATLRIHFSFGGDNRGTTRYSSLPLPQTRALAAGPTQGRLQEGLPASARHPGFIAQARRRPGGPVASGGARAG